MTDAELMTTDATVPGLEVTSMSRTGWSVTVDGNFMGVVFETEKNGFFGATKTATSDFLPTRNAAVQWILDQHKSAELTRQGALEAFKR